MNLCQYCGRILRSTGEVNHTCMYCKDKIDKGMPLPDPNGKIDRAIVNVEELCKERDALKKENEELKAKLAAEGWHDASEPLPNENNLYLLSNGYKYAYSLLYGHLIPAEEARRHFGRNPESKWKRISLPEGK
jgi:hypothetical protein